MDHRLFDRIRAGRLRDQTVESRMVTKVPPLPKFNRSIVEGLACEHLRPDVVKRHIDNIILCAQEQYPPGLRYDGSRRCTPIEEYNEITKARSGFKGAQRSFDIATSYVYLMRYDFSYNGEPLFPRFLYLPYVRPGGLTYISGKQWVISPVLADRVFSVGSDDIFIQMLRGKVTFYRKPHPIRIDGNKIYRYVVYSPLHNRSARKSKAAQCSMIKLGTVKTSMMHYLLCKFGFTETFRRYANTEVKVLHADTMDPTEYPSDEWVICRHADMRPEGVRVAQYQLIATRLVLAIPRRDFTPLVELMVAGFYYVIDHFPDQINASQLDNTWIWQVMLGYILWGDDQSHGKLVEDVKNHLRSLDGYVDFEVRRMLASEGVECEHIYDLFVHIIEHMQDMVNEASGKVSSMYGKQLMVRRYVLSDINNAIFEFLFEITSNNKKQMTKDSLNKILGEHFKPKLIFRITSGKGHGEISTVSCPGDNKVFKITSILVPQSETAGKGKDKESRPVDATVFLDASQAEVAGYCVLPKSSPFGRNRINPYLLHDPSTWEIVRKPQYIPLLDGVQSQIRR